jgi:eukaryotic-like serine/threonine-protein kinase
MSESSFGKYRLIAEIGHGGMADVYLAVVAGPTGSGFSKLTVVKRLRANLADEPEFVEMLVDEARISARLNHPNVVQTNEVGQINGQYYISMEYLDGQPLHRIQHRAQRLKKTDPSKDPFPLEAELVVIADTLAGLHHAHELADYDGTPLQVVHRDVTPQNIFVTYEGQVKVVDFGIAKAAGRASETRQGIVKGKTRYMAPEQAMARDIDRRADLFCVGVMLWEAAVGRRMWHDTDDMAIVQALIAGNIPSSPRAALPTVPEELDRVCRKALSPKPDDRYATAEDFRLDVEQYLADHYDIVRARRKLGAHVVELFGDKRNELRAIIEQKLAAMKAESQTSTPMLSLRDSTRSGLTPTSLPPQSTFSATTGQVVTPPPRKRGRGAFVFFGLLAVVGAAGAARFALRGARAHTEAARPSQTTQPAATIAAAAASVAVNVAVDPPHARVFLDERLSSSPLVGQFARDSVDHVLRVEATGYEPRAETLRFDRDVNLMIKLSKSASSSARAMAPPPALPQTSPARTRPAGGQEPAPPPPEVTAPPMQPPPPASTPGRAQKAPVIDKDDPW